MESFLHSAKALLAKLSKGVRIHAVMGNQACDMDSAVSSLIYAYFIHKANLRPETCVVPVLNIHQREFSLRSDVRRFLEEVSIPPELLIFRDNFDLKMLSQVHPLTLTLVDHNVLHSKDVELQPLVEEVIDHHKKELEYDPEKCQTTIEQVGSTCTLIAEKLFKELPDIIDNKVALLLYGTILLDTYCLSAEAKRVTPKDRDMIEKLEIILGKMDRGKLFCKLQQWKTDVAGMPFTDLLRKDVKDISSNTIRISVSSVPILLEETFKDVRVEKDLKDFATENGSQILVIMGIQLDESNREATPHRQIAVYSEHQSYQEQIVDLLEDASQRGPTLRLLPLSSSISSVTLYQQGNIAASRKVILPLLNSFLNGRPPIPNIGCEGGCPNNCDDSNNFMNNRRPTPEGRNEDDDVGDFDPLAAESEDVVVESVSTALGHLHVLGVGDPISHAGSSQSSSNQNSCPYTPQNSCTDGGLEQDPYARQILPSFNSREMMEKIESKRGKLRGYVGDGEGEYSTTASYPFTPKNSFVDGSFDSFIRGASNNSFDTGEFMLQVNDRVARFSAKRTEPDGAGCIATEPKKTTRNGSDLSEHDPISHERNPEGKDNDNCPEGTSLSDKLDKSDYKMDTSDTSNSSEKTSPIMDDSQKEAIGSQVFSEIAKYTAENNSTNSTIKSTEEQPHSTEITNFNQMATKTTNSRTDSSVSMSSFQEESELPSNYLTETVDFPASPHQMKLMQRSTNGSLSMTEDYIRNEKEDLSWTEQHEDDMLRHVLSPQSEDVEIKKDMLTSMFSGDSMVVNDNENSNALCLEATEIEFQPRDFPMSTPYKQPLPDIAKDYSLSLVKEESLLANTAKSSKMKLSYEEDYLISVIEKINTFYNVSQRIKQLEILYNNIKCNLTVDEMCCVLDNEEFFSKYLDEDFVETLQMVVSESSQQGNTPKKDTRHKVKLDLQNLDDSIVNHFEDELYISAVFERQPSIRKSPHKLTFKPGIAPKVDIPTNPDFNLFPQDSQLHEPKIVKEEQVMKTVIPAPLKFKFNDYLNLSSTSSEVLQSPTTDQEHSEEGISNYVIQTHDFDLNPSKIEWSQKLDSPEAIFETFPERPNSLTATGKKKRKITVNPNILDASEEHDDKSLSSLSNRSDGDFLSPSLDDMITPDDIATPDILDDSVFSPRELLPELTATEERDDERRWRTCVISGVQQKIDMKVIEPYKKVLSHGGYYGPKRSAIIVFSACYLPDHGRKDYDYVVDHLFLYVLTTLDQLVAEDYILVYLHGALERNNMPTFGWLKRCYTLIDRRLRKNLKGLYLVHPTFWLKTIVLMTKPFVSTKFARKLQFVNSLQELFDLIPLDQMSIPDKVKQFDFEKMIREKKRNHKGDSKLQISLTSHTSGQNMSVEEICDEKSNREINIDVPYRNAHSEDEEFTKGWV